MKHYRKFVFLVYFFLHSCSPNKTGDCAKIDAFLEEFLFQEGACYTLIGDKPMTSMLIFKGDSTDSSLDVVSKDSLQSLTYVDSDTYENYRVWKTAFLPLKWDDFLFIEIPVQYDPSYVSLYLVNIKETKKMFNEHFELFSKKLLVDNWKMLLEGLKDPSSRIWQSLLKDSYLLGLLYGYGQENVKAFCLQQEKRVFSETWTGKITKDHFPIPVFVVAKEDRTSPKFLEQRQRIQLLFQGQKTSDVTLRYLKSK